LAVETAATETKPADAGFKSLYFSLVRVGEQMIKHLMLKGYLTFDL
jgi:hypothetical protein